MWRADRIDAPGHRRAHLLPRGASTFANGSQHAGQRSLFIIFLQRASVRRDHIRPCLSSVEVPDYKSNSDLESNCLAADYPTSKDVNVCGSLKL